MNLKQLFEEIGSDLDEKPNLLLFFKSLIFSPSFRLLLCYRFGCYFSSSGNFFGRIVSRRIRYHMVVNRGCDISFNAKLGSRVKFAHAIGIVIGSGVVIEDDVIIYQNVTIGSHGKKGFEKSYPFIGAKTKVFAGAVLHGGIKIGEGAIIGANAVVNCDVPPFSTCVGIPGRIIVK